MTRAIIAVSLLLASIYTAHGFGLGREGLGFGKLGVASKKGASGGAVTNFILLVDNSSRILQTDNTSKICKAGGC